MIKCSTCADKFTKGRLCLDCGKAYCKKETYHECPFCKSDLVAAQIVEEKLDKNTIEWLALGTSQVGLVDFEQVPPFLPRLLHSSSFKGIEKYQLVLFPSKKSSWKITNYFKRKAGMPEIEYDDLFEESRYGVVEELETRKRYIFVNMKVATPNTVKFLVVFLINLFSEIEEFREVDNKIIAEALGKALFNHNRKLGISFVVGDETTREYFEILQENLPGIYAEYIVSKQLSKDYLKEIPDFLSHKIELLFSGIDYKRLFFLRGVYEIFNVFFQLSSILALAQEYQPLKQYVNNIFYSKNSGVKKRLKKDFPDVVKCIDIIIRELSRKAVYESYETYLKKVSKLIENVFDVLSPKYLKISEVGALFEVAQEYERRIEIGKEPYIPKFGSVEKFSDYLLQLFHRDDIYPELRILAGQLLESILVIRVQKENNYLAYSHGLKLVQELAQLIENSVSDIEKRLNIMGNEYGVIGYHDACLHLIAFSQFCHIMNDEDSAMKLINLSKRIAQQYNVLPMKIIHKWKDFVELHDYDKLLDVYHSFLAIDYSAHRHLEEQIRTMGHLASAIFKKETRENEFTESEQHALAIIELTPPIQTLISYSIHAIKSSEAFCHLVHLFRHIINANEGDTKASLRRAWLESQAMSESIARIDPLNKFALKTEILYSLISEDPLRTQKACKRLKGQSWDAPLINQFVNNVEKWLLESERLKGRRFLVRVSINESDPWERLFRRIIYTEIYNDLDRHIAGADAVVFVEGVSDAKILEQFAQKLISDQKILFMDVEGFTNMNYYSEAKTSQETQSTTIHIV